MPFVPLFLGFLGLSIRKSILSRKDRTMFVNLHRLILCTIYKDHRRAFCITIYSPLYRVLYTGLCSVFAPFLCRCWAGCPGRCSSWPPSPGPSPGALLAVLISGAGALHQTGPPSPVALPGPPGGRPGRSDRRGGHLGPPCSSCRPWGRLGPSWAGLIVRVDTWPPCSSYRPCWPSWAASGLRSGFDFASFSVASIASRARHARAARVIVFRNSVYWPLSGSLSGPWPC